MTNQDKDRSAKRADLLSMLSRMVFLRDSVKSIPPGTHHTTNPSNSEALFTRCLLMIGGACVHVRPELSTKDDEVAVFGLFFSNVVASEILAGRACVVVVAVTVDSWPRSCGGSSFCSL